MKSLLTILAIISLGVMISCEQDSEKVLPDENEESEIIDSTNYKHTFLADFKGWGDYTFSESLEKWLELKELHGDSYHYKLKYYMWPRYKSNTGITVKDGVVVKRSFVDSTLNFETSRYEFRSEYQENSIQELNTHDRGAPAISIDSIYHSCASIFLNLDLEIYALEFQTNSDGVVVECTFSEINCDDCSSSYIMNHFEWLE